LSDFALLGQYIASQFHVASDNVGGTVVTDPPIGVSAEQQRTACDNLSRSLATAWPLKANLWQYSTRPPSKKLIWLNGELCDWLDRA
jgi:hypothetical protein